MNIQPIRVLIVLTISAVIGSAAFAHDGEDEHEHTIVPAAVLHAPTAMPDRIVLTWNDDPATSQAVTWRTDESVGTGIAEIAPAQGGTKFLERTKTVTAVASLVESDLSKAKYHTAEFKNLSPETRYLYRVGDGGNWSEWFQFETAAKEHKPFSFIYFGDAQNAVKMHWSRVIRQSLRQAPEAKFFLHAGDLINDPRFDAEWGDWHRAGGWANGMLPSVATPGNHEYMDRDENGRRVLARQWQPQFAFPENGPEGLEESCYYFDYQGVRFISLDSNRNQAGQVAWVDKVLEENPHPWVVMTFHHPVYSAAKNRDNRLIRMLWKPIIDKHNVDIVLQGHDHAYGRSKLIGAGPINIADGQETRAASNGTVYVVSVSGPKFYEVQDGDWMQRSAYATQLFQVISIDGNVLQYNAYTAHGDLYDAFELRKSEEGGNRLVELIKETPAEAAEREAREKVGAALQLLGDP